MSAPDDWTPPAARAPEAGVFERIFAHAIVEGAKAATQHPDARRFAGRAAARVSSTVTDAAQKFGAFAVVLEALARKATGK